MIYGTDYAMYEYMYFNQNAQNVEKVEIGYKILMQLSYQLFDKNSYLFFTLCSALTIIPIYIVIKRYSNKPGESLFYFTALGFYVLSFNLVRQSIAIAICFFALRYMFNRKIFKYIVTILIASLFHMTALIMIPMYWIANLQFNKKQLLSILVIFSFSGILFNPIFNYFTSIIPQYRMYSSYGDAFAGIGTYIVDGIYMILIIFIIFNKNRMINENKNIIINLITFSTFFIMLSMQNILFARLIYYWLIPIILILPEVITTVKKQYRNTIQLFMIVCFLVFYFVHIYSFNGVYPYKSIF